MFNNVPVNGWPQIKDLEKLDTLAKQIEDMPTFTSTDRDWLDEWEQKLPELPEDPETDGVKVLTATTESGETVKSWENPLPIASASTLGGVKIGSGLSIDAETGVLSATSSDIDYSLTEQKTNRKWVDGSDIYERTYHFEPAVTIINSGADITSNIDNYSDISKFVSGKAYMDSGGYSVAVDIYIERNSSGVKAINTLGVVADYVTLQYTKASV